MTVKTRIANNILVAMSAHVSKETLCILEHIIQNELINVNMQEITTLPEVRKNDVEQRNYYITELFKIKRSDLTPETRYGYLAAIRDLITAIPHKSLDQMEESDIEWFLHEYGNRVGAKGVPVKASTWNNTRRFLSAFYTWMRKAKMVRDNPVEPVPAKKIILGPIDYFSSEEINKMRDACKTARERAIIEIFRSTGARIGELAEITMDQVNLQTGDVWIRSEKSRKYRIIFLDADARYYLGLYLRSRPSNERYLIAKSRAPYGQMSKTGIRETFNRISKRAGIREIAYPHKMRKTLGMRMRNMGEDIGTIQEIMGHANPAVTAQYYAQSTPQTLRRVREMVG